MEIYIFTLQLEGSPMSVSKALYMDPYQPTPADATATLNVTTPRNIVPGSLKIKVGKHFCLILKEI